MSIILLVLFLLSVFAFAIYFVLIFSSVIYPQSSDRGVQNDESDN